MIQSEPKIIKKKKKTQIDRKVANECIMSKCACSEASEAGSIDPLLAFLHGRKRLLKELLTCQRQVMGNTSCSTVWENQQVLVIQQVDAVFWCLQKMYFLPTRKD